MDETPRPGWANMAIDHALLDRAKQLGERWLRLYRWAPHCLSFGRHEPAMLRYDRERIRVVGIDAVRRPTGGRAVWHANELTYAVAAPSCWFGPLSAAYLQIHRVLADALRELGMPAYLAPPVPTPPLDSGACFSQPVGGEIMIGGRKVVGSAQLRQGGALLQHGSIQLNDNQHTLTELTLGESLQRQPRPASEPWASFDDVAVAVMRAAARSWPGTWESAGPEPALLFGASSHYPRYQSDAWTWAR
jgi:lipoate-protein ligase A